MSFNRTTKIKSEQRIRRLDHKLEFAAAQIRKVQALRLWTGALTFAGFVLSAVLPRLHLAVPVLILFVLIFPWLVSRSRKWSRYFNSLKAWREFEDRQEARRRGLFKNPSALSFSHLDEHGLAQDLDLFGSKSLFTQIDETFSVSAALKLARWMLADPVVDVLLKRQALLKELSLYRWFFLRFRMSNPSTEEARFSSQELMNSLENFPKPSAKMNLLLALVVVSWIGAVGLVIWYPVIWVVFIFAHLTFLITVGKLLSQGEGVLHYFSSLAPSFEVLESDRAPRAVRDICVNIRTSRPARRIRNFEWPLTLLTVESHPLVYLIVNFFLPWSSLFSFMLMRQVASVRLHLRECFNELEEIEALGSLVVLTSDQTQVFAEISSSKGASGPFRGRKFLHPLIDRSANVANDFGFAANEKMVLLTGSNMSGKSTFLRTLGLNQILANMGAPVFAAEFVTSPFRVRSCIRVSDSVEQGVSYFYAEVQRLKKVLDACTSEPPVLYLIDEIFRGTNNRERLVGGRSVVEFLLKTPSIGFITTHDLELTQIASEPAGTSSSPRMIHNYHFRDEARSGQMYFPYELFDGPSPTTNALKIMKLAGLPVRET